MHPPIHMGPPGSPKLGRCAARISPKPGRCARIARIRRMSRPIPPKPRRCAGVTRAPQSRQFLLSRNVLPRMVAHRPASGGLGPHVRGGGRLSQAKTLRRALGASSLLRRNPASGARDRPFFGARSRLGREASFRTGRCSDVPAGRRLGPPLRLSQAGTLRSRFSPKPGRCAGISRIRSSNMLNSPKQGRCAASLPHRPALGEAIVPAGKGSSRAGTLCRG